MSIEDIKKIFDRNFLPIKITDKVETVLFRMGEPDDHLEDKKNCILIFKYKNLQLVFIEKILVSYNFYFFNSNQSYSFKEISACLFFDTDTFEPCFQKTISEDSYCIYINNTCFIFEKHTNLLEIINIQK
jgi:hypothetical protein